MPEAFLSLATQLLITFSVAIVLVLVLWLLSIAIRDVSIIDMFFAVIMLLIVGVSSVLSPPPDAADVTIIAIIALWATRMSVHLIRRNWGHGEDQRYSKLRSWVDGEWAFHWLSLRKVFLLQGIVLWFATLPAQIAILLPVAPFFTVLIFLGAGISIFGLAMETVADQQLSAFRKDPAKKGMVLQSGLWRYSRHPNYFGELCVWWGIFIVACANPWAFFTVIGPLTYSYLIINVTGQATLDKKLAREKPAYADYMQRTSGMIPRPPKPHAD